MINVVILGSTGSIGTQTLEVIAANPGLFRVRALTAHANHQLLRRQIESFQPEFAVLTDESAGKRFIADGIPAGVTFRSDSAALLETAALGEADVVLIRWLGYRTGTFAGSDKSGKNAGKCNKERWLPAGALVVKLARQHRYRSAVDSEHSAIAQCLAGERHSAVKRLLLTASGGPFRGRTSEELDAVTLRECLKHPNWTMGRKITIDSATLMNKGLEVIEARWLFDLDYDEIKVVVHPQSIVHSMVEFVDGSVKAQLGLPDMKLPIQYALNGSTRLNTSFNRKDFTQALTLTFEPPDIKTFRALPLAYEAGKQGGTYPCVLNAANEVGVQAFIDGKIGFSDMLRVVEEALAKHNSEQNPGLDDYLGADAWARRIAGEFVNKVGKG